jgi:hypothetical protein
MSVMDRFIDKAVPVPECGCWIWIGGVTGKDIAAEFGTTPPAVSKIKLGHTWRHVA